METLKILFWILLFIIFYTYVGYGMVLYVMVKIKRFFSTKRSINTIEELPEVFAFNSCVQRKRLCVSKDEKHAEP
ncbi:hypothetical protein [Jejuia pallidilutea]|uniref:hypothetical protein n=1 Tax=Jejuia pallidilutea TaxID=504487 RepID=UPI0019309AC1|nr:hypothetical protein [Jejuia pallidilutea]